MAGDISRNNGKRGGRPPGTKSPATIEKEAVVRAFRDRVLKAAGRLFTAQLTLAEGIRCLFRIDEVKTKKGTKLVKTLVTDPEEMQDYFSGKLKDDKYSFITIKEPDNNAIDSLLDRALGKALQPISDEPPTDIQDLPYEQRMRLIRQKYAKGGKKQGG